MAKKKQKAPKVIYFTRVNKGSEEEFLTCAEKLEELVDVADEGEAIFMAKDITRVGKKVTKVELKEA